jgi:multimeric flavodoxin WrbA
MKIVAILGSPREEGNTSRLMDETLQEIKTHGIDTEKIVLSQQTVNPCLGHERCRTFSACTQRDDAPGILEKLKDADGIILGSPVYFYDMSAWMKALIDRSYFLYTHGIKLNAVCAGIIVIAGGGGVEQASSAIKRFIKASSDIPNEKILTVSGFAFKPGSVKDDKALLEEAGKLGSRMAEMVTSARK